MREFFKRLPKYSFLFLPIISSIFILIVVLKEVALYDRFLDLYNSLIPVFSGFVIAFLLQPIIDRLHHRLSYKSAVMVVYAGILILAGIIIIGFVPILYRQIIDFAQILPDWMAKIESILSKYQITLENLSQYQQSFMEEGYTIVLESMRSFISTITKYGIGYITAFFISIDLDFWKRTCRKVFRQSQRFSTFYKTMSNIVFQYLVGTALDLSFIAITSWVILYAADFPNALLYAVLLALSNLFPYIGPTIGLIIVFIVGILSYDQLPLLAFLLIWIIQQMEANFIQPLIFNKTMDVRPILTFISLFISEALFGIPGVLLSPIIASIMQIGFRSYLHAKTCDKIGEWDDIWYDFDEAMKEEDND